MAEAVPITSNSAHWAKAVPSWESIEMVPKGGLEPTFRPEAKLLENADLVDGCFLRTGSKMH
jgi:hypothetical protein